jgi:SAM-dependent methyltransferase
MKWSIDEFLYFRGFLWISGWILREEQVRNLLAAFPKSALQPFAGPLSLPSDDVERIYGLGGRNARFSCCVPAPNSGAAMEMRLFVETASGKQIELENFRSTLLAADPYHSLQTRFYGQLRALQAGRILEIGSRNRSGIVRKGLIPPQLEYVGLDILPGENVDVVGDAHELSLLFPPESFDAIFTISVFEHLMMPWKATIEMNRVLKPGGLVMVTSHQTWPLHETPWDYWRFSDQAWHALFNTLTGFEILETALGERASIAAHALHAITKDLDLQPAFCGSAVLCRKVGNTSLKWDVRVKDITDTRYPV